MPMKRFSNEQVTLITQRARALSDPTRVRIIEALARDAQSVGTLAGVLDCEPSTVSRHLQILFNARMVERRREASTVIYSLGRPELIGWCRYLAVTDFPVATS
jgi:DNA-binding transcriptional ArsR family regulator